MVGNSNGPYALSVGAEVPMRRFLLQVAGGGGVLVRSWRSGASGCGEDMFGGEGLLVTNVVVFGEGRGNEVDVMESPRREVVRSSAGAAVVYPPFLGSFA